MSSLNLKSRGPAANRRGGSPSQEEQGRLFSVWRSRALETKLYKPPPLLTGPRCRCAWNGQLTVDAQAANLGKEDGHPLQHDNREHGCLCN